MIIERLAIHQLRNIRHAELHPSSQVNLITGCNAAGKSTVLESIDLLARGRSFRTHLFNRLVTWGKPQFTIAAHMRSPDRSLRNVGIEKSRSVTNMHIAGERVESVARLARLLPVQTLHPESHQLIQGGPSQRRAFLDWGMFHVEPRFLPEWQRFRRILRQRNAALKSGGSATAIRAWDVEFCETAQHIDTYRRSYLDMLEPVLERYATLLPGGTQLDLLYQPGWPVNETLDVLLEKELSLDMERVHTRRGPHRADLEMFIDERPANGIASRGQQKIMAAALKLAQAKLLFEKTGRSCIFLVDDLPAELEPRCRQLLLKALTELDMQLFITSIGTDDLDLDGWPEARVFHVEQGRVRELLYSETLN